MYLQAAGLFFRHLSILLAPILAAVIYVLLNKFGQLMTDPVGGLGVGLYNTIGQLCFLVAFGIAIVQANNAWRGYNGAFEPAWEEAKRKFGGIALGAIGFQFITYVAQYIGSVLGGVIGLLLYAVAAFFLIYTIPAAAIGGLPGQLAISGSIQAVRARPLPAIGLAVAYVVLMYVVPIFLLPSILRFVPAATIDLIPWALQAIFLAYLAFPFAKTYDETAFRARW